MTQNKKKILILGEDSDQSTSKVIDWIRYYGAEPLRVNENPNVILKEFVSDTNGDSYIIDVNGVQLRSDDIHAYWYRRGDFFLSNPKPNCSELDENIRKEVEYHIHHEYTILEQAIHKVNESKQSIGSRATNSMNKLNVLMLAKRLGIDTPKTKIVTHKKQLHTSDSHQSYITKSISEGLTFSRKKKDGIECYSTYTEEVQEMSTKRSFFPSLIQEKLEKHYELRIFYVHGEFYSMAIFSQNDSQTAIDFRKYNRVKPNRSTPFSLPKEEEAKLHCLMVDLGLNTGSIDMVVTKDKRYVFLEVNPVGQFGMVSSPCNYKIEKRIAKYLSKHE